MYSEEFNTTMLHIYGKAMSFRETQKQLFESFCLNWRGYSYGVKRATQILTLKSTWTDFRYWSVLISVEWG